MAKTVIKVSVVGDVAKLQKAFSDSAKDAKSWGDKMAGAGKALTVGLTAPIVAGASLAIKAGAEEARQMEVLADIIKKRIPDANQAMIDSNEEWVANLQKNTAIADSEIREMEQKFISAGASIEDAQKLTALAFDTAAATGKEATSVGDAFVKGINGQVSGLSRLGIATTNAAGETKSFAEITDELAETMGGTAATAADTAEGRAKNLALTMGDLQEDIGRKLLPVFEKLVGWLQSVVNWFSNLSPAAQNIGLVILGIAAAIGPLLIVGAKLIQAFGLISKAFSAMSALMAANPWLLLIAAVVALVIIIVTNWDTIVAFLKKTWAWITDTSKKVWEGLKNAVKAAIDFVVQLFLNWTLPGLIMKHWETIKKGAETVRDWIKGVWNGLIDWFKGLPSRVSSAIGGLFDGLKTAFKNAVNWIIDKWNNFKLQIKLPALLGGATIGIDTPNIPRFHQGGLFRAAAPGGEGLAILRDRERVLRPGQNAGGSPVVFNITVNAGMGTDGIVVGRQIVEALQRYSQINGPVPITTRAG